MPGRITIRFPADRDDVYAHRVRNFAEDLYRQIQLTGMGTVADIDRAIDVVTVLVGTARHFGAVQGVIRKALQRHKFEHEAVVTRSK